MDRKFKVFDELEHEDKKESFISNQSMSEFAAEEYGEWLFSDIEIPDRTRVVEAFLDGVAKKFKIRAELKIIVEHEDY